MEQSPSSSKNKVPVKLILGTVVGCFVVAGSIITYSMMNRSAEDTNGNAPNSERDPATEDVAQNDTEEGELKPGEPYLNIRVTSSPTTINDLCQEVQFKFEAENIGDTALLYTDLQDQYYFSIVSDDAKSLYDEAVSAGVIDITKAYSDDAGLIPYSKLISDFGEIAPGETKSITYTSLNYVIDDQHDYYWTNSFTRVANGSANYYIQFGRLSAEREYSYSEISNSPTVVIRTDLVDPNGGLKYCEHEVISDPSIDFYSY